MASLAEKYNNPGCVKQNGWNEADDWETNWNRCSIDPWCGSSMKLMDNLGHAIFDDVSSGIRAMGRIIQQKYCNGKFTLNNILDDWAPAADTVGSVSNAAANNPSAYADFVAFKMNSLPHVDLVLFKRDGAFIRPDSIGRLVAMMSGMSQFEAGYRWVKDSKWLQGIALLLKDFVEE